MVTIIFISEFPYQFYFSGYSFIQENKLEFYLLSDVYSTHMVKNIGIYNTVLCAEGLLIALQGCLGLLVIIFAIAISDFSFTKDIFSRGAVISSVVLEFSVILQIVLTSVFPTTTNPFDGYLTIFGYVFLSVTAFLSLVLVVVGIFTLLPFKCSSSNCFVGLYLCILLITVLLFSSYSVLDSIIVLKEKLVPLFLFIIFIQAYRNQPSFKRLPVLCK
jgi:hypothetical protein